MITILTLAGRFDLRTKPQSKVARGGVEQDPGWSTVLWVSEWSRIDVPAHFLHGLIFAPGVHKPICLLARPLTRP